MPEWQRRGAETEIDDDAMRVMQNRNIRKHDQEPGADILPTRDLLAIRSSILKKLSSLPYRENPFRGLK